MSLKVKIIELQMIVFNAFSKGNFLPYCSGDEKWQVKVWAELVCSEGLSPWLADAICQGHHLVFPLCLLCGLCLLWVFLFHYFKVK